MITLVSRQSTFKINSNLTRNSNKTILNASELRGFSAVVSENEHQIVNVLNKPQSSTDNIFSLGRVTFLRKGYSYGFIIDRYKKKYSFNTSALVDENIKEGDTVSFKPISKGVLLTALDIMKSDSDRLKQHQQSQSQESQRYKIAQQLSKLRPTIIKDPRYQSIQSRQKMKENVGKIVSIPQLPNIIAPQGYESTSSSTEFVLTEERYKIYEEIDNFFTNPNSTDANLALAIAGPFGIGKSGMGLLLAAHGFMNNSFVVYLSRLAEYLEHDEIPNQVIAKFIRNFVHLNADLAQNVTSLYREKSLLDICDYTNPTNESFWELIDTLRYQDKYPVIFIYDDHQESISKNSPISRAKDYVVKNHGKKIAFVSLLSHGEELDDIMSDPRHTWKLHYLQPFTMNEAYKIISTSNTKLSLPKDTYDNEYKMDHIKYLTNLFPFELQILSSKFNGNYNSYELSRLDREKSLVNKIMNNNNNNDKSYLDWISMTCLPKYRSITTWPTPSNSLQRSSLFYRSSYGIFECSNGAARNALFPYLSIAMQSSLSPLSKYKDDDKKIDISHEKWIISRFISGNDISLNSFFLGSSVPPSSFIFNVDELHYFRNISDITPNINKKRRLYVSLDNNNNKLSPWSCIYDDGDRSAFFSFSYYQCWNEDIQYTFEGENSKNAAILSRIRSNHIIQSSLADGLPLYHEKDGSSLHVYFFVGCGQPRSTIIDEISQVVPPMYSFIQCFAREEIESIGVQF